jgi:hypothetical protein
LIDGRTGCRSVVFDKDIELVDQQHRGDIALAVG